jgi:branched-chain amino acid transport system ATP-binding protein
MSLSERVVVMDDGKKLVEGAPEAVRHDSRVIEAYLGHKHHNGAPEQTDSPAASSVRASHPAFYPAAGVL